MAIPEKDYPMYEAMQTYGGSFVKELGELLQRADHINYAKLEAAFPEYFKQYRKMAEKAAPPSSDTGENTK